MKIISANKNRYLVLGTMSARKVTDIAKKPSELKNLYHLADIVLQNGDNYYICSTILEAEWKEVKT